MGGFQSKVSLLPTSDIVLEIFFYFPFNEILSQDTRNHRITGTFKIYEQRTAFSSV